MSIDSIQIKTVFLTRIEYKKYYSNISSSILQELLLRFTRELWSSGFRVMSEKNFYLQIKFPCLCVNPIVFLCIRKSALLRTNSMNTYTPIINYRSGFLSLFVLFVLPFPHRLDCAFLITESFLFRQKFGVKKETEEIHRWRQNYVMTTAKKKNENAFWKKLSFFFFSSSLFPSFLFSSFLSFFFSLSLFFSFVDFHSWLCICAKKSQ